jgi:HEAT repeat protein
MHQEFERLIADLRDPNPTIRIHALRAIGRPGSAIKVPISILTDRLKDEDVHVRRSAANALSRLGEESAAAIPSLIETFTGEDKYVNQYSIKALTALGPKVLEVIPPILLLLKNERPEVRVRAAKALGEIAQQSDLVIPNLLDIARTDTQWKVRSCAIEAIGRYGPRATEAIPFLVEALGEPLGVGHLQLSAAIALSDIGVAANTAIPALVNLLSRDEIEEALSAVDRQRVAELRYFAAVALGRIGKGNKDSVPALIETLESIKSWKVYVCKGIVQALWQLGPEARDAIPSLLRIIREEEDTDLLWVSTKALARIEPDSAKEAIRILVLRLKDSVLQLNDTAAQKRGSAIALALGKLGPDAKLEARDAIPLLAHALRNQSGWLGQNHTIRTLGSLSPEIEEAVTLLREASQSEDIGTKIFAKNELGRVESRSRKKPATK